MRDSEEKMNRLKINKAYATKYQKTKERQELNKLKQKYGDVGTSSDESSTSESEDEDAEAVTPQLERDFLKTLTLIKRKDPKIYEKGAQFYKEEDESEAASITKDRKKPMYLKDYDRERLMKRGVKALLSDSESESEYEEHNAKKNGITYVKEQQMLKDSFKKAIVEDDDEDDGEFLTLRDHSSSEKEKEEADYQQWLKSSEAVQQFGSVDEDEKFLTDYILKREYCDQDDEGVPSYNDIIEEESEDELEREEEFERKFNFRYEEPDQEFIRRFPRTIKETVRRTDDKRKKKRKLREERKKKEKETRKEEIRKLKNLKRKEIIEKIEKLKEMTGNAKVGFLEDDLDGDFDAKRFDKLMNEIYDDEYYKTADNEKPVFEEEEEDYDNWDDWAAENEEFEDDDTAPHCEDPDFNMDADYIPQQKLSKRKSKLAAALYKKKPVFDPEEKTFEEYFDEYYKLDYEDVIEDLPVRFKYREVLPNNFGLSTEEILNAQDRELNQWCSLAKASKYYTRNEEVRERQRYKKKARSALRKRRVFSSVYATKGDTDGIEEANDARKKLKTVQKKKISALKASSSTLKQISRQKKKLLFSNRNRNQALGRSKFGRFSNFRSISDERLAAYGFGHKKRKPRK